MAHENLEKLSFLIVQSVVVVLSASYYQKEYSGYLFTIPDGGGRNQADAQNWCNRNGSRLLAITNSSIQTAAVAFINDAIRLNQLSGNNIITDGMRTSNLWRWLNGSTPDLFSLSIRGQDANTGYALSYVYLYGTSDGFSMYRAQPTDTNYYICEFSGQSSCVNGSQYGSQCFQSVNDEAVTWFEARNRCLLRGGDLGTFEFIKTNDGLNTLNGSWINPLYKYWIGLRRQWWTWQSIGSDVTYSQWADGQPYYYSNENIGCLCLRSNDWKWMVCRCTDPAQVVCIRASSSAVTTVATPQVTTATKSLISPSTLNNLTTAIQKETNAPSTSEKGKIDKSLAIGLGVGLGGGVLFIIILIIALILLSRKGYISCPRKSTTPKDTTTSSPPPDLISSQSSPNGIYAPICPSNESFQDDIDTNPASTEYAPLQIVGVSSDSKHGNRGTLAPPSVSDPSNTEL